MYRPGTQSEQASEPGTLNDPSVCVSNKSRFNDESKKVPESQHNMRFPGGTWLFCEDIFDINNCSAFCQLLLHHRPWLNGLNPGTGLVPNIPWNDVTLDTSNFEIS